MPRAGAQAITHDSATATAGSLRRLPSRWDSCRAVQLVSHQGPFSEARGVREQLQPSGCRQLGRHRSPCNAWVCTIHVPSSGCAYMQCTATSAQD
jgi:hypothetical protein